MRELPEGVAELIPGYLPQQRWYGGSVTEDVEIVDSDLLTLTPETPLVSVTR